jgi:hypothetical protein
MCFLTKLMHEYRNIEAAETGVLRCGVVHIPVSLIPILMMEAVCDSETSTDFYKATRRNIPEYGTIDS